MCAWGVPCWGVPTAALVPDSVAQPAGVFPGVDMGGDGDTPGTGERSCPAVLSAPPRPPLCWFCMRTLKSEGLEAPSLPVPLPSGRLPVDSTKTSPTGGDGAPSGEVSSRIMPSPCAPLALLQMREPLRRQSSQQ